MKALIYLVLIFLNFYAFNLQAQDQLLQKDITLHSNQIDLVFQKTENNIKVFLENFSVKLDNGSKIVSPQIIAGTILQPVLKVSVKKCVFIFCQTIDLDAEFTLNKVASTPDCDFKYQLTGDLQRSSILLADLYSQLNTDICIKKNASGAMARLIVGLERSGSYQKGAVQKQALGFIKLQAEGLVLSFMRVMKINGIQEVL